MVEANKRNNQINKYFEIIRMEQNKYSKLDSLSVIKLSNSIYKNMPKDDLEYIEVCRAMMEEQTRNLFSIATTLLKKKKTVIDVKYINIYENILLEVIKGWGQVDQYCYRVLNPIMNSDYSLYPVLEKWSTSLNKDVRRASLVSMIISSGRLTLDYDYNKMISLVEKLKEDEDIHVRKAVGWVLKCAYVKYPVKVEQYLRVNVRNLDRIIYRYALEHVENPLRQELINL